MSAPANGAGGDPGGGPGDVPGHGPAADPAPAPPGLHVLFLTDNFPPESNAPAVRTFEHAREWVRRGHRVTVVTGCPNFPEGRVYPGYRNRWYARERTDGIDVVRVKTFLAANAGFLARILDYLSFMVAGFAGALVQRRPDVVVATSPQFFCAVAGRLAALARRRPFVLEIRDLWPASIVAVGAMRESAFIRAMERVERWLYRGADAIVVVTRSFRDEIAAHGIDRAKIAFVPNGVDARLFGPRDKDPELVARHGLEGAFVVGYIGTHGMAHDLGNVLEAVALLRGHERVRFAFVGAGAERARVESTVRERGLDNAVLVPAQPREQIPRWLGVCDACLIPLRDSPTFAGVIPSKLFECQATGTPVVMSLPAGEATAIVESTGCGVTVPPERPEALAAAIEALSADPERARALGEAGLRAARSASREARAADMLEVFERCAG